VLSWCIYPGVLAIGILRIIKGLSVADDYGISVSEVAETLRALDVSISLHTTYHNAIARMQRLFDGKLSSDRRRRIRISPMRRLSKQSRGQAEKKAPPHRSVLAVRRAQHRR
jgi:hypothetical protein